METNTIRGKPKVTRIRKKVPLELRKRTVIACDRCRKQRIKCTGGVPCERCRNRSTKCEITSSNTVKNNDDIIANHATTRLYNCKLERIVQYFCPNVTLSYLRNNIGMIEKVLTEGGKLPLENTQSTKLFQGTQNIQEIKTKVGVNEEPVINVTSNMVSTADESFITFIENSNNLERKSLSRPSGDTSIISKVPTSNILKEQDMYYIKTWIKETLGTLPSAEVIIRLVNVFLNICETNFFYIHPQKFTRELSTFLEMKEKGNMVFLERNWGYLVILLGLLSVAASNEYIQNGDSMPFSDPNDNWDDPGHSYFRCMLPFVGVLINKNDIESIQALLLMGVYMTSKKFDNISSSIDLGYKYIYLSVEIAICNNLHLRETFQNENIEIQEFYKRIWWSCYALERIRGFNLGKPEIIKLEDITVDLPQNVLSLNHNDGTSNYLHQKAMIQLICIFGRISLSIYDNYTKSEGTERYYSINSKTIRMISQELDMWKSTLPIECCLENLDPTNTYYRANNHLNIYYYVVKIYLGKPFLLYQVENNQKSTQPITKEEALQIDYLTSVCVDSAFSILEMLSVMKYRGKLGIYSSSDLFCCNLSLFVLISFLKLDQSPSTILFLRKGFQILKILSKGCSSAKVDFSRFKKLEIKLGKNLSEINHGEIEGIKSQYVMESSPPAMDIDINIHPQNLQLTDIGTMVLSDAISSNTQQQGSNGNRNDHINGNENNYRDFDELLVGGSSQYLDWIKNVDLDMFI